jgi:hypothetical protein
MAYDMDISNAPRNHHSLCHIIVICFFVDRDALRSEGYTLNKMAIEHKLLGDSSAGMFDPKDVTNAPPVSKQSTKRIGRRPSSPRDGES